jgi:hypothetical protein
MTAKGRHASPPANRRKFNVLTMVQIGGAPSIVVLWNFLTIGPPS